MKLLIAILSAAAVIFLTSNVLANDDGLTVTGEKGLFTVLTSDTVPHGNFSFGFNYNNIDRDPYDTDISYFSATFGYGITDNLEIVGVVPIFVGYDIDPKIPIGPIDTVNGLQIDPDITQVGSEWRDGFGDIRIGAKFTFYRTDAAGIAVRPFIKLPSANEEDGVGTGKIDYGIDVVVSGVAGSVELAGNAGVISRGDPDYRTLDGTTPGNIEVDVGTSFTYGVGAAFPAESRLQGIVEFNGEVFGDNAETEDYADLTAGFRVKLGDSFYVSAGGRRNLAAESDNAENPWGGIIQLSYAPGRETSDFIPPPPTTPPAPPMPPPAPQSTPPQAQVPAEPDFVWPEVYFPFDEYVLTAEARGKLDSVARYLTDTPNLRITIEGHCCYIGTDEYNLALGQHRADAIRDYLTGKGISADRMKTISYGEAKPKYDNEKEITRRFNRRGFFISIRPQ